MTYTRNQLEESDKKYLEIQDILKTLNSSSLKVVTVLSLLRSLNKYEQESVLSLYKEMNQDDLDSEH